MRERERGKEGEGEREREREAGRVRPEVQRGHLGVNQVCKRWLWASVQHR